MNRRPPQSREGGRGKFIPRRRVCAFCVDKLNVIDYKDIGRLRRFVSDRGRIETRRRTGTCAKHQRALAVAIKRARHLALLPFTATHSRDTGAIAPVAPVTPIASATPAAPMVPAPAPAVPPQ